LPGQSHAAFQFWRETRWNYGLDSSVSALAIFSPKMSFEDFCPVDPKGLDLIRSGLAKFSPKMSFEDFCPVNPMPPFNFGAKPDGKMVWISSISGLAKFSPKMSFEDFCPVDPKGLDLVRFWTR
jgi:hypothetical protein